MYSDLRVYYSNKDIYCIYILFNILYSKHWAPARVSPFFYISQLKTIKKRWKYYLTHMLPHRSQHVPNEPRSSAATCNNQPYAQGHKAGYCMAQWINLARFGTCWPIRDLDISQRLTWLAGRRRSSLGMEARGVAGHGVEGHRWAWSRRALSGMQSKGISRRRDPKAWASRLLVTSARWARAMSAWESAGYTALARLNMELLRAGSYSSSGPGFLRTVVPRGHRGLGRQLVCCTRTIQIRIYITLLHIQVNFKLI